MAAAPLSSLSDPTSPAKVQILVIPVQPTAGSLTGRLSGAVFSYWTDLIKRHQSVRSDEIHSSVSTPASTSRSNSHIRGSSSSGQGYPSSIRARFLPAAVSPSTSISRANNTQHVHLAFPSRPPERHLYPLNLLRLASFPLVVIGITVDPGGGDSEIREGYSLAEEDETGDIGAGSTPTIPGSSQVNRTAGGRTNSPSQAFEDRLSELFPATSAFPLVRRLVVVPPDLPKSPNPNSSPKKSGHGSDRTKDKGKGKEDIRYAPAVGADVWISKLLGELLADLFGELGELVTALETPTGLKTLSSTLLPSLTSTSAHLPRPDLFPIRTTTPGEMPSRPGSSTPTLPHSQSVDALSAGSMGITLHRALTPGGRPTSTQPSAISPISAPSVAEIKAASASNPSRRFSAIPSPFSRTPSASSVASSATAGGAQPPAVMSKYTSAPLAGVAGGRLMKVLGDVYLLVGAYADAIRCYDDGAERCRQAGDVLWEAMSREGRAVAGIGEAWETRDGTDRSQPFSSSPIPVEIVAHLLSAQSCLSRAPLPYPPVILSPLPQAPSQSISLTPGSVPPPERTGTGEGLLAYLYTSLGLRIAHFHLIIWASGGWGSIALSCLLSHTLPRTFPLPPDEAALRDLYARRRRHRFFALLSARSGITRTSIFGYGESAVGPVSRALTKSEQMAMHTEVVWLARWLDLHRHEAIYGREVVRRCGGMMLEEREQARRSAGEHAGHSRHGDSGPNGATSDSNGQVGLGLGMAESSSQAIARRKKPIIPNAALNILIERVLAILNVYLVSPLGPQNIDAPSRSSGFKTADDAQFPRFGWPEVQVDTLQTLIHVADNLADHELLIRLAHSALRGLSGYLHQGSQAHLLRLINAAQATLKRRGKWRGGVEWWVPGKMVLSLEVASLPANRLPVEHSASEIAINGRKEPFLYNPRVRSMEAGKTIIVANEQVDVFITLSNPFAFDLDIADLSLITSGVQFLANPLPLVLPANSVQTVRLTGIAPEAGDLYVQGVSIRLPDGATTDVHLPVVSDKARVQKEKRRSRAAAEVAKMKRSGTNARLSMINGGPDYQPQPESGNGSTGVSSGEGETAKILSEGEAWLLCTVIRELPLLWVKRSNLTHGTVMLYDGERTTLRLILENSSATPVDFLKLSFVDNTIREGRAALNEEMPPDQVYEIEWDMIKRPVFSQDDPDLDIYIPPNGRHSVSISCLGKVGCTDGSIRIDYGYIDRKHDDGSASFHTRHITFPVLFTVYHALEVTDVDILPLPRSLPDPFPAEQIGTPPDLTGSPPPLTSRSPQSQLQSALIEEADGNHCLVAMTVCNIYGVPFEVSLSRSSASNPEKELQTPPANLIVTRMIPSGASERLIIPVPRASLETSTTTSPIPSLTSRQYIVDKSGRSARQHQADLELFWYRQHLLSSLRLSWAEGGTKRVGELSVRNQRLLTADTLETLRVDQAQIKVLIDGTENPPLTVKAGEFVKVQVEVHSRLEQPLTCLVRLDPLPASQYLSDPGYGSRPSQPLSTQHVVFDGMLTQTLPMVQPGQSRQHTLDAIFLAEGSFNFRATAAELLDEQASGHRAGGRVWHSEITRVQVG